MIEAFSHAPDLPRGDPALLNKVAWRSRWEDRLKSVTYAKAALEHTGPDPSKHLKVARGYALVTLAWQAKWRGDFDASLAFSLEAETLLSEKDHPDARAHVYSILGVLHYSRNRLDLATCATDRGLKIAEPDKNTDAFVDLLLTRATILRYKGDRSRAGLSLGRARDIAEGAELARVEHNIARWMLSDDAFELGKKHSKTSLDLCERHANRVVLPYTYEVLGACHVDLHNFECAKAAFVKGLDLAISDKDFRAQCQIIQRYAALEYARGKLDRARDLNCYGAEIAAQIDYALWGREFALSLAQIYEDLGDLKSALSAHKRAWRFEKDRRT